jgi:hypothetical protein
MNILLTSVGRRVTLLKEFRQSMRRSNITGKIVAADLKPNAPASFLADVSELVPRVNDPHLHSTQNRSSHPFDRYRTPAPRTSSTKI